MRRFGIIFCLVLLLASPGVALADVGQVHVVDDGWNSSSYKAFTGGTSDQFQAACNFFSVDGYSQLNQSQRDYLMSNSTWTAFYDAVTNGPYDPLEYQLFPGFNFSSYELWSVDVDSQVYFDAKDLLLSVRLGIVGEPGGGATDGAANMQFVVHPYITYALNSDYSPNFARSNAYATINGQNYSYSEIITNTTLLGDVQLTCVNNSSINSGYDFFAAITLGVNNTSRVRIYALPHDSYNISVTPTVSDYEYYSPKLTYAHTVITLQGEYYTAQANLSFTDEQNASCTISSMTKQSGNTITLYPTSSTYRYYGYGFSGSDVENIPTTPDPTPQPPVQPPDPGTDVPTTDPPTWPTIQLPDIDVDLPSVDIDWPTLAEGLDYTDLLRTIIARLESIGDILGTIDDDLSTHCQHLQRQIHEQAKYLGNLIVQGLHSDLAFLGTQIQSAYKSINSCIRDQIGWLASQMQWVLTYDSDLEDLTPWLMRIWNKIGKGSYYQPDPIDDEPGFLDWLEWIWEHVIGLLSEVTDGALDELLVVLDDLIHRFPFSIPWDVMALLALFAHTPEPIAFTITLPDVPGLYGGVIEVDCSGWDWMAGMVRPVLLVMFAYRLAMWTPKALESLGLLGEFKRSE